MTGFRITAGLSIASGCLSASLQASSAWKALAAGALAFVSVWATYLVFHWEA